MPEGMGERPGPAPDSGLTGRSTRPVATGSGLTARQFRVTLLIVLLLSLAGGLAQMFNQWRDLRAETRSDMAQTLELIRGPATEAAYQLSPDLAKGVVDGLLGLDGTVVVTLRDNFGRVLAARRHPAPPGPAPALAGALFGDVASYHLSLSHAGNSGPEPVGELSVRINPGGLLARFLGRTLTDAATATLAALLICVLVVAVFYAMITRPLVHLANAIAAIDPARPLERPVPPPRRHAQDELGLLTRSLNALLAAFQDGLTRRDRAEAELTALTRDLEARVVERTAELSRALDELGRRKAQTEQAFAALDRAHRDLDQTNGRLMESIRYAAKIQDAWLPDARALDGVMRDIAVRWQPLEAVGGDYFWLEKLGGAPGEGTETPAAVEAAAKPPQGAPGEGTETPAAVEAAAKPPQEAPGEGTHSFLAVLDCTGHGVPGAFMTMVAAAALDRILHERGERDPGRVLALLDSMVRERLRQEARHLPAEAEASDDGLDAAICVVDHQAGVLRFAGANLPLLYAKGGEMHEIRGTRASLGYRSLRRKRDFQVHEVALEPGMSFYLFTDGATDHIGGSHRRLFGRKRLAQELAAAEGRPLAERIARVEGALAAWRGGEARRDDMTLIAFTPA